MDNVEEIRKFAADDVKFTDLAETALTKMRIIADAAREKLAGYDDNAGDNVFVSATDAQAGGSTLILSRSWNQAQLQAIVQKPLNAKVVFYNKSSKHVFLLARKSRPPQNRAPCQGL